MYIHSLWDIFWGQKEQQKKYPHRCIVNSTIGDVILKFMSNIDKVNNICCLKPLRGNKNRK